MKQSFFSVIVCCLLSSCNNYYQAIVAVPGTHMATIREANIKGRYLVLRTNSNAFVMKNISFSDDKKKLQCTLDNLPDEHQLHLYKGIDGKMKYAKPGGQKEPPVLNEVHIYIGTNDSITTGPYILSEEMIQKTEVLEKDVKKTARSQALGLTLGITTGVAAVIGIAVIGLSGFIL